MLQTISNHFNDEFTTICFVDSASAISADVNSEAIVQPRLQLGKAWEGIDPPNDYYSLKESLVEAVRLLFDSFLGITLLKTQIAYLSEWLNEVEHHDDEQITPLIFIFDDIQAILPASSPEEQEPSSSISKVSLAFRNLLLLITRADFSLPVFCLLSSTAHTKLHIQVEHFVRLFSPNYDEVKNA